MVAGVAVLFSTSDNTVVVLAVVVVKGFGVVIMGFLVVVLFEVFLGGNSGHSASLLVALVVVVVLIDLLVLVSVAAVVIRLGSALTSSVVVSEVLTLGARVVVTGKGFEIPIFTASKHNINSKSICPRKIRLMANILSA